MSKLNPTTNRDAEAGSPESGMEQQRRLAREADARDPAGADRRRRLTLKGLADVDAGRLIDDEAMQAWADSLGTDREQLIPGDRKVDWYARGVDGAAAREIKRIPAGRQQTEESDIRPAGIIPQRD